MRSGRTLQDCAYWLTKDRIPVTKAIVVSNVLTLVLWGLFRVGAIGLLAFSSGSAVARPWTFFTYPLISDTDLLGVVFAVYWLWIAGGSLERSMGSTNFGIYFFLMSAVSALGLFIGGFLCGLSIPAGIWIALAGLTVSFAMRNPEDVILFMFVLPLKLKYLALISAASLLFTYGRMNLILGIFSVLGCVACYLHATQGSLSGLRSWGRSHDNVIHIRPPHAIRWDFNVVHWYRSRRDEKRLKDLFKRSGMDD